MKISVLLILLIAMVWLTACVDMTPVRGHALSTTPKQRFTDEAINRDWAAINSLRSRIAAVRPVASSAYAVSRAEGMTEFGVEEYAETDKTGVIEAVLDDALAMLLTQEKRTKLQNLDIPKMPGTLMMRQDLWDKTRQIKKDPIKFNCVQEQLARLEVGLIELAHEQYEVNAKLNTEEHTKPYETLVDVLNEDLDDALSHCKPVSKLPRKYVFAADALFKFDKFTEQDILDAGKQKLNAFAKEIIKNQVQWQTIIITGHTDRLGRHDYNLRLGQKRADTIRDYLLKNYSLPANRIKTRSMGYVQPVVYCSGEEITDELIACLQPNRRVEIELR